MGTASGTVRVSRLDKNEPPLLGGWVRDGGDVGSDADASSDPRGCDRDVGPNTSDRFLNSAPDDPKRQTSTNVSCETTTFDDSAEPSDPTCDRLATSPVQNEVDAPPVSRGLAAIGLSTLLWAPLAWLVNWIC